jgi:MoaA/NifB/PqqE/SkfB family radical SAM enzyme
MTYSPLRFVPSVFLKRRPVHLTFFVTRRCNASCPFCFYSAGSGAEEPPPGDELSLAEIERLAPSLGSLLWMAFSGGEIFLRRDLVEISGTIYDENRPSIMLYPTNGLMPVLIRERTVRVLERCPRSVVVVKLSLDGLGERHDAMRGVTGAFERVMETYRLLGGLLGEYRNFELGVNTVFCSENQDEMDGIIDFVRGLEMVKTHTISLVRGEVRDGAYKDVDMEKYLRAVRRLEGDVGRRTYRFRGAGIKAAQDNLQRRLIYHTVRENRRLLPCYAGRLNLVLTETGDVFPCESFRKDHLMGNVRDFGYDMKLLLGGERAEKVVSMVRDGCFCSHECYMMTNIFFGLRMYPSLLREVLARR